MGMKDIRIIITTPYSNLKEKKNAGRVSLKDQKNNNNKNNNSTIKLLFASNGVEWQLTITTRVDLCAVVSLDYSPL